MTQEGLVAVRGSFWLQLLSGLSGSLLLILIGQTAFAFAFGYGALLMIANGVWLATRLGRIRALDAAAGQRSLYAGAAMRFVALVAGLLLAQLLGLYLLMVAAGMFVAQMALFMFALIASRKAV